MHAGKKLVDHFHLRARARIGAQFVHLDGDGFQNGVGLLVGGFGTGTHDGQFALGSARGAAGDRRVDQHQAFGIEALAQVDGEFRRDRAAGDDHGALGQRGCGPVLAEQDFIGLVRIDHQDDDDGDIAADIGRVFRGNTAFLRERLRHFGAHVVGVHFEPLLQQRARYAQPHRAQSDHACLLLLACRHFLAPRF